MPTPFREDPQFSATGRYAINVQEHKAPGPTRFHDTETALKECGLAAIPKGSMSRFNNPKWAVQRGYTPCNLCILPEKE
jgi:hypothetical protein